MSSIESLNDDLNVPKALGEAFKNKIEMKKLMEILGMFDERK